MIPQERVNEAAETNCHYPDRMMFKIGFGAGVRFTEAELNKTTISPDVRQNLFNYFDQIGIMLMVSDFHEIENYMKPEVKRIAMEFAEWIELESPYEYWGGEWKNNTKISESCNTAELFAKFEEERNQNGG